MRDFAATFGRASTTRQQAMLGALVVVRDEMLGTPLDKLRVYAEKNDPHGFTRDILGLEPTQMQDELLEIFEKKDGKGQQVHTRILVHSGTNLGKTVITACEVCYRAFAVSQLLADDGLPQGAIVELLGPGHDSIADTSWREILKRMERAAGRGFPFKTMFGRPPRPTKADWKVTDEIFFRSIAPAKSATHAAAHSVSGRHAENMIAVVEEAAGVDEPTIDRVEVGLTGPNNLVIFNLNPDPSEASGPAFKRYQGAEYLNINLSCLDFRNVVERHPWIGGGSKTHLAMDESIRHNYGDLGQRKPEEAFHDIRYALKEKTEEEQGPRDDGERGMEGCEVRTYRPNVKAVASDLGQFPQGYGDCPFEMASIDASFKRWKECENPSREPDRYGFDPAVEGPDSASLAAAWGPTIDELWYAVWDRPKEIPQLIETGGYEAGGEWVVVAPIRIGKPVSLGSGMPHLIAEEAEAICGSVPVIADDGGEGRAVYSHMDVVLGMNMTPVGFGTVPERLLPGETPAFNRRVQLYLRFADLLSWNLADMPPSDKIRDAARAQRKNYNHDVYRQVPGADKPVKVVKLEPKRKIRNAAGGGLDDLEACILACQATGTGGWSFF